MIRGWLRRLRRVESNLRVLHTDHTVARGGAEYALLRILQAGPLWGGTVLVPRGAVQAEGVFGPLAVDPRVTLRACGPAQFSGASKASGRLAALGFAARAVGQSIALRSSRDFHRSDVLHANTSRAAVYTAVACLGSRKRLVVHLRDMVDEESLGTMGFSLFTKIALRRANGVIANSRATLDSALPYVQAGCPVAVIPSAAGLTVHGHTSGGGGQVRRVGMVARLDPWKGQDLLLRSFASVFRGRDVRLILAGGAPFGNEHFETDLHTLAQCLGIEDQVEFPGHVDEISELISSLDICVQASLRPEPLGQNVLQYLSQGRATIAANAGGPAEWIKSGENGLLFELADERSLTQALRTISEDSGLRARLALGAAATPGLLPDEQIAALHLSFFELVAKQSSRGVFASSVEL